MTATEPANAASAVRPDQNRIGGLAWTRRTRGQLTRQERRRLLAAIAVMQAANTFGRVKLALGRLPAGAADIDVRDFEPPDSKLAREAEAACAEQHELLVGHCYRAWMWGLTLAALDRAKVDRELFYCAALVHDFGATTVASTRCCAVIRAAQVSSAGSES